MSTDGKPNWIAFVGGTRIASGPPREVATKVKEFVDTNSQDTVLVVDAITGEPVELDLRGSVSTVVYRLSPASTPGTNSTPDKSSDTPRPVGRPKLGVVAREVTLLPRHWEWLATQPGGASVALRKLVEHARRANREDDRIRQAREAAYRFMSAIAGNEPGFEEATRALFAGDREGMARAVAKWPADVRDHALSLAAAAAVERTQVESEAERLDGSNLP